MDRRLKLQELLESVLGSKQVYYQPPENLKMQYPAIVYNLDGIDVRHADNIPYSKQREYQVTLITRDPDSITVEKLTDIPLCGFVRRSVNDNLNNYYFELYF